jgi:hypothetical protein
MHIIHTYREYGGRSITFNVFKKWMEHNLEFIDMLNIENFMLGYFRADDFACFPQITTIRLRYSGIGFFSGKYIFIMILEYIYFCECYETYIIYLL